MTMTSRLPVLLILGVVLLLIYWVVVYNSLINGRNQIRRAFSGIDVQLKKRWDLVPQLVSTVKAYAAHEAELFEKVIEARARAKASSGSSVLDAGRLGSEQLLAEGCSQVLAVAEAYPELKSGEHFMMLQRSLTEIEAQIAASRRSYNAHVVKFNNTVESFPSSMIAGRHGFRVADYFSIDLTERKNVRF